MMTYNEWHESHSKKHKKIVEKLKVQGMDEWDIVQYFIFDNMVEKEPDFCELYVSNTKCHEMYELNCYMCGCPHFRFYQTPRQQDDVLFHSVCSINSKRGKQSFSNNEVHQDCSGCTVPHGEDYVLRNFDHEWEKMMENVRN